MLFNLYLNEIPFLLDRQDTDPIILPNGTHLNCLFYADDLVLISHSAEGLQKALSVLAEYCNKWLLSVNSKKTKVLIFQKKCRKSIFIELWVEIISFFPDSPFWKGGDFADFMSFEVYFH